MRQSVLIMGTALGLAIAGPMFTTDPKIALVWITVALAGLAAAAPVGWSIPSLIAPRPSVGKVGGILNFGNQVSGIVAPIVTGYILHETGSMRQAFAVAAILLLLGIAAYVFLLGRIEPEERDELLSRIYRASRYVSSFSPFPLNCDGKPSLSRLQVGS